VTITSPPIFFVSYARADAEFPDYRERLENFVSELSAKVAVQMPTPLKGVSFIDGNIQTGEVWSDSLGQALMQCRVGLALYSPNYFTREWCGKEFQVFLNRRRQGAAGTGIIPVWWSNKFPGLPSCASPIQHDEGAFPSDYASMGVQQLVKLKSSTHPAQYEFTLDLLARRIVAEAKSQHLDPLPNLDFEQIRSAWEESAANDPQSHTRGNISKTCFVFVSRSGWDWIPYQGAAPKIGALAQTITGDLGLRYEEIPCNAALPQKLKEANDSNVPTVLVGDPASLGIAPYAQPMRQYDSQYLLNCAALIAWEPQVKESIETDPRWIYFKTQVCKQKAADPPPYHEWRSIFSQDDLQQKTKLLIEQIRSRLMKQLVSDPAKGAEPRKAEDPGIAQNAAAIGIATGSLSQLGSSGQ
jgi:hypothetical protein